MALKQALLFYLSPSTPNRSSTQNLLNLLHNKTRKESREDQMKPTQFHKIEKEPNVLKKPIPCQKAKKKPKQIPTISQFVPFFLSLSFYLP